MALITEMLGCPLLEITRSYWAVKRDDGKWICQRQTVHNWSAGTERQIEWYEDIIATGDNYRIKELWLFCPPNRYSSTGNTARIPVHHPASSFMFTIATHDAAGVVGAGRRTLQAQVIGRVNNPEGDCVCFAWDPIEDSLLTPETTILDPATMHYRVDPDGRPIYPMVTNIFHFGQRRNAESRWISAMWRSSLAPIGRLAYEKMGVVL